MPGIDCLDICRPPFCFGVSKEKTPLLRTVVTRTLERAARVQNRNVVDHDSSPTTWKWERNAGPTVFWERQHIINELVETERRYVERLTILDVEFMQALVILESNCDLLRKLYTQVQMLKKYHSVLLENLLAGKSVSSVFNKTGDYVKLTQAYINLHPEVSGVIEKLSYQSKKFRETIQKNELMHQVQLNSLLNEPVERIPRYQLLLEDLLANTPKAHPEFQDLLKALEEILRIILKLNKMGSTTQTKGMWRVYHKIRGRGSSLWTPSRKLVCKNVFWRVLKGESVDCIPPMRVRTFLFTDSIIICDGRKVGRSYKFLDEVSLCDISSLECFGEPLISLSKDNAFADLYGFKLSAAGHRNFGLYHSNLTEVKTWFELIIKYRSENAKMSSTKRNEIKNRVSTMPHTDLEYGTMSSSRISGPSELTSDYASISKGYNTLQESSLNDYGMEYTSSSNESGYQSASVYTSTSMFENLKKLVRTNDKYIKVSDIRTSTSSVDYESICEQKNHSVENHEQIIN